MSEHVWTVDEFGLTVCRKCGLFVIEAIDTGCDESEVAPLGI